MASIAAAVCALFVELAVLVDASAFLRPQGGERGLVSASVVEQALLTELASLSSKIVTFEEELRPLFSAMPKNEHGSLEPSVTRYALHRYFAQKHGWHVNGLEPAGGTWNSSSPSNIIKDRVPAYIQGLFQERLHGRGLGLHELAAFAAVLTDLIRREYVGNLQRVYSSLSVPTFTSLSSEAFDQITDSYTTLYFHDLLDTKRNGSLNFAQMLNELEEEFLTWKDVLLWARDLRRTHQFVQRTSLNPFAVDGSFEDVEAFALQLGSHFGSYQNMECRMLKDRLVDIEYRGTGRVRLSDFYDSGANDANWHFVESVEYLRALGALDESEPSRPSVIIPNFVGSRTNCVFPSSFYSVCCLDECEHLLSSLERAIESPAAAPARIAEVISALPSDTVDAPRNLSLPQLRRLDEIAALHGGEVPMHGRLFAQWMHHAYPRECPFPHAAGTTNPLSHQEWKAEVGSTEATDEEMLRHVAGRKDSHKLAVPMTPESKAEMPWISVEELVVSRQPDHGASTPARSALRVVALVALGASVSRAMFSFGLASPHRGEKLDKHFV